MNFPTQEEKENKWNKFPSLDYDSSLGNHLIEIPPASEEDVELLQKLKPHREKITFEKNLQTIMDLLEYLKNHAKLNLANIDQLEKTLQTGRLKIMLIWRERYEKDFTDKQNENDAEGQEDIAVKFWQDVESLDQAYSLGRRDKIDFGKIIIELSASGSIDIQPEDFDRILREDVIQEGAEVSPEDKILAQQSRKKIIDIVAKFGKSSLGK